MHEIQQVLSLSFHAKGLTKLAKTLRAGMLDCIALIPNTFRDFSVFRSGFNMGLFLQCHYLAGA